MTTVSIIVAAAENDVIGRDGGLPWRLPDDLRWFRRTTMGKTMIMGRKTYESNGRPLPGRQTIVLTSRSDWVPPGPADEVRALVRVAGSLREAFEMVRDEEEVFVTGGEAVFREALPETDRVYLTRVHAEVEGDTRFRGFDPAGFALVHEERHEADERHAFPFTFLIYEKRRDGGTGADPS